MITFFTLLFSFCGCSTFFIINAFLKKSSGSIIFTASDNRLFMSLLCFFKRESEKKSQNTQQLKKKLYRPFLWMGFNCLKATATSKAVYFLPLSPQKFLVLTLSTSEGWKAESTLEPPSGFEHGTSGLGIQSLNHQAVTP